VRFAFLAVLTPLLLSGALHPKVQECRLLEHRGKRAESRACFQRLTASGEVLLRAEGYYGLRDYTRANLEFKAGEAKNPKDPNLKARWGRLLIEPFNKNYKDAADLFQEAIAIEKTHAGALYGMALAASNGFESKASEFAKEALAAEPTLVEAQELMAQLALEDVNFKKAVEEADKAIKMSPEALDAFAVRAAVEALEDRSPDEWFKKIAAINPRYGEGYAIVAHHLVLNRRYDDGIAYYRKALELEPDLLDARSQLGINLMRMGKEVEAKQQLETAFNAGFKESTTTNSLKLIDSYKNFLTYTTPVSILKLDKKEAGILRIYFEQELLRCVSTYEKKYKVKLPVPVQLEVYPNHDDFAVRTMGMPGLGALGVTFGTVVAMDSPSGRKPGAFHWAGTLWHEMSHVYVLTATRHRVPRWFTEGVAVHEESAIYPEWGDRLTPDIVMAVKEKKLLPVSELDRGFIRPNYPNQVIVSYYQAGQIIDFIKGRWGWDKVLAMMHSFAAGKSTPVTIREVLALAPEEFDKQFLGWLDKDVKPIADNFDAWRKQLRAASTLLREKKYDEAIADGEKAIALYRDYVEAANAYETVSDAALAKGDKKKSIDALSRYAAVGGRNPDTLKKLALMQEEAGDKRAAAVTLEKVNFIYPIKDDAMHKRLGELYLGLSNPSGAVREFSAWLADKPNDKADAHYHLARAFQAARQTEKAEEHVLEALESAPGFRPAQKLLLELNAQKK
jgi:cellulose synthase operon protein C